MPFIFARHRVVGFAPRVAPTYTSKSVSVGAATGCAMTIVGTNLLGATVYFGATPVTPSGNTGTLITLTTPNLTPSTVAVSIVTSGGTVSAGTFEASDALRYLGLDNTVAAFDPADTSRLTLAGWTVPIATGAGAPAVTIHASATAPALVYNVRLRITQNGTGTTALYAWDLTTDGGASWTQQATGTLAATITLGTTGCVLACASGSYTTSHSYTTDANWSACASPVGTCVLNPGASATRPGAVYGTNGQVWARGYGGQYATGAIAGLVQPSAVILFGYYASNFATNTTLCDGYAQNTGRIARSDATTMYLYAGAVVSGPGATPTVPHMFIGAFSAAGLIYQDAGILGGPASVGAGNLGGLTLFSLGTTPGIQSDAFIRGAIVLNAAPSAPTIAKALAWGRRNASVA